MRMQSSRSQRGVALIVVLMLLLIVTILGLASLRGALLQERMSSNTADRSRTFQVAEASLREAEDFVATIEALPAAGCNEGVCGRPTGAPPWEAAGFNWETTGRAAQAVVDGINSRYLVEYMGPAGTSSGAGGDCTTCGDPDAAQPPTSMAMFRVTVRSFATATNAEVILQSGYEVPMP